MDRALGGYFGSERFSKDERFFLMLGGQSTVYTLHIGLLGGSVYRRRQRPFKNDSFATRGFPTLFILLSCVSLYQFVNFYIKSQRIYFLLKAPNNLNGRGESQHFYRYQVYMSFLFKTLLIGILIPSRGF